MRKVSRRDGVKLLAGLAVGARVVITNDVLADEILKPAQVPVDKLLELELPNEVFADETLKPAQVPVDKPLELALQSPSAFMFAEQVTSSLDGPGDGHDLVITSATPDARGTVIYLPSRSMRIFRADAGVDEFTKQGGLYWRFGNTIGKTQFKHPGALVMVVRDGEGTVHWYSLEFDMRC
jgi:hypothetical protein